MSLYEKLLLHPLIEPMSQIIGFVYLNSLSKLKFRKSVIKCQKICLKREETEKVEFGEELISQSRE